MSKILYTIGHSSRTKKEFIDLLIHHEIHHLIDVRTIPKSRLHPWFNKPALQKSLAQHKIQYDHLKELGGLRYSPKDSINQAWENKSFRGFADYMQTPAFFEALKHLNSLLKGRKKTAIMCAEALPWRCHRSLIADAEIIRGYSVYHITSHSSLYTHKLTSFAKVNRKKRPIKLYYPK